MGRPRLRSASLPLKLLLFECVDEFRPVEKKRDTFSMMFDGLNADGRRKVGLASAGAADGEQRCERPPGTRNGGAGGRERLG